MNADGFVDIMENVLKPWVRDPRNCPGGWTLQMDNDPKHRSKKASDWFQKARYRLMEWPSQSADLNPIEHLWEVLDRAVRKTKPRNLNHKFEILKQAWERIDTKVLDKLIQSMPRRMKAVIDSNGWPTKY